jgi:hypothetical protein
LTYPNEVEGKDKAWELKSSTCLSPHPHLSPLQRLSSLFVFPPPPHTHTCLPPHPRQGAGESRETRRGRGGAGAGHLLTGSVRGGWGGVGEGSPGEMRERGRAGELRGKTSGRPQLRPSIPLPVPTTCSPPHPCLSPPLIRGLRRRIRFGGGAGEGHMEPAHVDAGDRGAVDR